MKKPRKKPLKTQINKGTWTDERLTQIKRYLRDPGGGDPDNVKRQLDYYKEYKFSINNGRVYVKFPDGTKKELLSDSQAIAKVK